MLGDRRDGRPDIFKPRNVRRAAWLRGCELPLSGKWDEVDDEESGSSGLIVLDEGLSGSADEDWFNRMGDFNGRFSLLVVRTCVFFFGSLRRMLCYTCIILPLKK